MDFQVCTFSLSSGSEPVQIYVRPGKAQSKFDNKFRNENFDQGFWSLIVCLVGALSETIFGLASFVTCLHYSDVVERLQLYSEVKQLAEEYPEYYGYVLI